MDHWRKVHLLKHLAKPGHEWNKFGVGNLETLSGNRDRLSGKEGVREDLLKYYKENYSSNVMTLVILSTYSIEVMTNWAIKYFTAIPNHN